MSEEQSRAVLENPETQETQPKAAETVKPGPQLKIFRKAVYGFLLGLPISYYQSSILQEKFDLVSYIFNLPAILLDPRSWQRQLVFDRTGTMRRLVGNELVGPQLITICVVSAVVWALWEYFVLYPGRKKAADAGKE